MMKNVTALISFPLPFQPQTQVTGTLYYAQEDAAAMRWLSKLPISRSFSALAEVVLKTSQGTYCYPFATPSGTC